MSSANTPSKFDDDVMSALCRFTSFVSSSPTFDIPIFSINLPRPKPAAAAAANTPAVTDKAPKFATSVATLPALTKSYSFFIPKTSSMLKPSLSSFAPFLPFLPPSNSFVNSVSSSILSNVPLVVSN